ncbi:hypothetical protein J6590_078316 [Homalodisca vitripennis]|nr:hypothetical protein J6590_078316 [Homalodisca vitripennis]
MPGPPEQEEKGSGALARVPRGRHYPYGLESKTAPEVIFVGNLKLTATSTTRVYENYKALPVSGLITLVSVKPIS